jgi:hypothetical protein
VRRILKSRLFFSLALLFGAAGSLLVADSINNPPARADLGYVRVDTTRKARVLILLIDSWRHETALDSVMMPNVNRLSRLGASGKIETVFEGFSIPAIRSAFSGSSPTQLMNLIRNFRFRALPIESAFLDASRIGKHSLIVGDEVFTQFGSSVERRVPTDPALDMYGLDRLRPAMALDAYRSGAYDLVVSHFEAADWRAHEVGIHSPVYAAAFAKADSTVADFARALRPGDYLIVFGDHGHNEQGEHKTGIYIPTHGLFIGPDIRAGVVFPSIPISDIRFVVDHALGIELRAPQAQAARLSTFLPVELSAAQNAPGQNAAAAAAVGASHSPRDYLLCIIFLAAVAGAITVGASGAVRESLLTPAAAVIVALFIGEFVAQQQLNPAWSFFLVAMLIVSGYVWKVDRWSSGLIAAIALFFASRFSLGANATALIREPVGVAELIPMYVAGTSAKLAILLAITGRRRAILAALLTAALAMLEFRVWDYPAVYIAAIVLSAVALFKFRNAELHGELHGEPHQLALVTLGYCALYFTLRLPLYEYAWVDLFIIAVWLASRTTSSAFVDALTIMGAFALTCVWLPSGLEWGFLYGLFPAYVVELHVGWFVPAILLKLPLLLLLTFWATGTRPTRRFVSLILVYAAIRLIGVWLVRLAGGSGALVWPMAEQGVYLTVFAIAAIAVSTRNHQRPIDYSHAS